MSRRRVIRRIITIILSVVLVDGEILLPSFSWDVHAANGILSGEGTEDRPYLIEDAEDWNKFAENINSAYYK